MGHITQAKELLKKQQICDHKRVAFIIEEHRYIPQGYARLDKLNDGDVDLGSFALIDYVVKNICLDCGLQLN